MQSSSARLCASPRDSGGGWRAWRRQTPDGRGIPGENKKSHGVFLILVGRAQAPVWEVSPHHHLEWKKPMPFVNNYSFHIVDRDWGHVTIKLSGHPPFPAQIILNGHEYVACQARKVGLEFSKEGNCFTTIVNVAGLAKIADTLSESLAIGRLRQVCEGWIYSSCLGFALDSEEQERSAGFSINIPSIRSSTVGIWCSPRAG